MASTRKPRGKKELVDPEVTPEGEITIFPMGERAEYLEPEDLSTIGSMERDLQNAKLSMALEEQVLENLGLKLHILKETIEKQKGALQLKASEYNQNVSRFDNFKKSIWPKYGLTVDEPMGYDPVTGKLKFKT